MICPYQLSLSLHYYLLYLPLNSSDGNDALLPPLNVCKMVFNKEDKVLAKRW